MINDLQTDATRVQRFLAVFLGITPEVGAISRELGELIQLARDANKTSTLDPSAVVPRMRAIVAHGRHIVDALEGALDGPAEVTDV